MLDGDPKDFVAHVRHVNRRCQRRHEQNLAVVFGPLRRHHEEGRRSLRVPDVMKSPDVLV